MDKWDTPGKKSVKPEVNPVWKVGLVCSHHLWHRRFAYVIFFMMLWHFVMVLFWILEGFNSSSLCLIWNCAHKNLWRRCSEEGKKRFKIVKCHIIKRRERILSYGRGWLKIWQLVSHFDFLTNVPPTQFSLGLWVWNSLFPRITFYFEAARRM